LALTHLLDAVASEANPPIGIIADNPERLLPALIRVPEAHCLTETAWGAADHDQLPLIAAFTGGRPTPTSLAASPPASLQTVLWCDPALPLSADQIRQAGRCLSPSGVLAIIVRPPHHLAAGLSILRLRSTLRRAGLRLEQTVGCLGPSALIWSARARLALVAGRPDRYDRSHAAMRAAFAEEWPWALLCQRVLLTARRPPC
jgi:hypothetical protein